MGTRLELQSKLEELLGTRNVYYQPAENLQMAYPAIKYQKADDVTFHGDNIKYMNRNCYEVTVIDELPDNAFQYKGVLNITLLDFLAQHNVVYKRKYDLIIDMLLSKHPTDFMVSYIQEGQNMFYHI